MGMTHSFADGGFLLADLRPIKALLGGACGLAGPRAAARAEAADNSSPKNLFQKGGPPPRRANSLARIGSSRGRREDGIEVRGR